MTATWIVHALGSEKNINNLIFSIQEVGRNVEFYTLREASEAQEILSEERRCCVVTGSIYYASTWRKQRPNWVGNWHDKPTFLCSRYYAYWGKYLVQDRYTMLPWGELNRRKDELYEQFGGEKIFLRPDSGEKEFIGQVIERERFHKGLDQWMPGTGEFDPAMLCVVAAPRVIRKELRLLIADKKVATGSTYFIEGHHIQEPLEELDDRNEIIEFAEKVLNDNPPPLPPVHNLDVALCEDGWRIMEVGCFCCSGLYAMDRRLVAKSVSEVAEREFANVQ